MGACVSASKGRHGSASSRVMPIDKMQDPRDSLQSDDSAIGGELEDDDDDDDDGSNNDPFPSDVLPGPRASYSGTGGGRLASLQHQSSHANIVSNAIDAIVVQTPGLSGPVLPPLRATTGTTKQGQNQPQHIDTPPPWELAPSSAPVSNASTADGGNTTIHEDEEMDGHTASGIPKITKNKVAAADGADGADEGGALVQRSMSYEEYRLQMEGSVSRSASVLSNVSAMSAIKQANSGGASNNVFEDATNTNDNTNTNTNTNITRASASSSSSRTGKRKTKTKSIVVGTPGTVPLDMSASTASEAKVETHQDFIELGMRTKGTKPLTSTSLFEQAFEAKLKTGTVNVGHVSTGGVTPLAGPASSTISSDNTTADDDHMVGPTREGTVEYARNIAMLL